MFTGIVEEVGLIREKIPVGNALRFRVGGPSVARGLKAGDSVSCNGVCLTAEEIFPDGFSATAVPETLDRSTLGNLAKGDPVNLEAALKAGSPMGGHIVQGHVDGVATVSAWRDLPAGAGKELTIRIPPALARYCVEKGSLALHGVSLTIAAVAGESLRIALVPHTLAHTNLGGMRAGDRLNFEVDLIGKYVEKLLGFLPKGGAPSPELDTPALGKWGYGV
jgi:riboflavin synthase